MANQTVYPYGTGGSLPSSVGIINDLTTGGADKALAAEQGKVLNQKIEGHFITVDAAADLSICDENGAVILELSGGHIKTKNFDSSSSSSYQYNIV